MVTWLLVNRSAATDKPPLFMKYRNAHPAGIMKAKDLFHERGTQLFDRKTGDWIKTVYNGNYEQAEEITPTEIHEEIKPWDRGQLSLF